MAEPIPAEHPSRPPLVELDHVTKSFGDVRVLADIDLRICAGEVVTVLGPSGSGKSTLCRVMNGLEPVDAGIVRIAGEPLPRDAKELARVRADIGMVFQSFNLFAGRTVLDNVTLGPIRVRRMPPADARDEALRLLERVGLAGHDGKLPAELSGGQQQRVAIARALAMHPKLILFDEPTSALDPEMVTEVLDVMTGLAHEGMTMVVVTHEMAFARRVASRVLFLADGGIVEDGSPADFFGQPRTARAREFLAKMLTD